MINRHPVRFFVHKRPHVDYFLEVVSIEFISIFYLFDLLLYTPVNSYGHVGNVTSNIVGLLPDIEMK